MPKMISNMMLCILVFGFSVFNKYCEGIPTDNSAKSITTYSTRYDDIDVDAILASSRLLQSYVNCLLDKGPCSPEGKLLKEYLPDALQTECSKCSVKQKKTAGTVLSYLLQNHKDYWQQLIDKYDKDGKFLKDHEAIGDGEEDYSDLDEARK